MGNRRKNNKKKRKSRGKYQKNNMVIVRGPDIMPDRIRTKMTYYASDTMTSATYERIFKANSAHDPWYSTGGGKAGGFDQLASLYGRYMVRGASIRITAVNCHATMSSVLTVLATPDVSTSIGSANSREQAYSKSTVIPPLANQVKRLSMYASTKSVRGYHGAKIQDDELEALVTTSPAKLWYFRIFSNSHDASTAQNLEVTYQITQYVDFFHRNVLPLSA